MSNSISTARDKSGLALNDQRFPMLADIARTWSDELVFPTHFDVVVALHKILQNPQPGSTNLTQALAIEPLPLKESQRHRVHRQAACRQPFRAAPAR